MAALASCSPAAAPTVQPPSPTTQSTNPTTAAPAATKAAASAAPSGSDIVRLVAVSGKSQAGYRVREQLANLSAPSDAVGTTSSITGTIVGKLDGTIVSADSQFVVDLSTLKSDQGQRDNFLRQSVLQTNQYRNATFAPTATSGLPATLPTSGSVAFKLMGDLTIKNITKSITWDATCQIANATTGTCHATTSFAFADVGLTIPRVFTVLSIVDKITLEVDVDLQRASN
jgi:polyisoprenoid-binding protein YceI